MKRHFKRYFLAGILSVILPLGLLAQVDRTKAPEAGPAPKVKLGEYKTFKLKNGLTVLVVENHKVPKVSYSLVLNVKAFQEGDQAGFVSIAGDLLSKGTTNRTNEQLGEEIDFLGANLSTGGSSVYVSGLSRYNEKLMELMADVTLHPSFPEEEFEKLKNQVLTSLKGNQTDPKAIRQNVSGAAMYGKDHPYGEVVTKESVNNITLEKCRQHHQTWFKPNITYLAVVGDIKFGEAKKLVKKYFHEWTPSPVPTKTWEQPKAPEQTRVVFSNRDAAPQTSVSIIYPLNLPKGDADVVPCSVMNSMLGSGGSGLLFKNLREDKGWTYGAYSSLRSDPLVGRFYAGAEVHGTATDSAFVEMTKEMKTMISGELTQDHFNMTKATLAGNFARSLESPSTIARFALNIERYNLPKDYYQTYLERLEAVTLEDVHRVAKKYLRPEKAIYLAVGERSHVPALLPLDSDGVVEEFDYKGDEVKVDPNALPEGLTAMNVVDNYLTACGGREALKKVKTVALKGEMNMQGMALPTEVYYKDNKMFSLSLSMNGNLISKTSFNGSIAKVSAMGQEKVIEGPEAAQMAEQALIIPELLFSGEKIELVGADLIDGKKVFKIQRTNAANAIVVSYFDAQSGLKIKESGSAKGISQTTTFSDYREVNGIKMPFVQETAVGPQQMKLILKEVSINQPLDNSLFQ